jgi:hypothetical protein
MPLDKNPPELGAGLRGAKKELMKKIKTRFQYSLSAKHFGTLQKNSPEAQGPTLLQGNSG